MFVLSLCFGWGRHSTCQAYLKPRCIKHDTKCFCFAPPQATNQNDTEANNEPIGILYISIEGKQANNVFSLVTAKGDVTKPEATQPETPEPELGTQADNTKPGNGVGMVTATGPHIAMTMLIARLAIVL